MLHANSCLNIFCLILNNCPATISILWNPINSTLWLWEGIWLLLVYVNWINNRCFQAGLYLCAGQFLIPFQFIRWGRLTVRIEWAVLKGCKPVCSWTEVKNMTVAYDCLQSCQMDIIAALLPNETIWEVCSIHRAATWEIIPT